MPATRVRISAAVGAPVAIAAALAIAAIAMGCNGDDGDDGYSGGVDPPSGQPTAGQQQTPLAGGAEAPDDDDGSVSVTLREYEITTDPFAVVAGSTTFRVQNAGPDDEHEFIVIRTDLNPAKLPTNDDGSVSLDDLDVVQEVEPVAVGETQEIKVDLSTAAYVLICNVVEEDAGVSESHYQNGMRESFRVDDQAPPAQTAE